MYVLLVESGRRTIEEVPEQFREEVKAKIEGGNQNG